MGKHESSISVQLVSRFRGVGMARVLEIIPSVRLGRKYCLRHHRISVETLQVSSFL